MATVASAPSPIQADEFWAQGVLEFFRGQQQGRLADASRLFQDSVQADPTDGERQLFVATLCVLHGHFESAEESYEAAIAASPTVQDAYLELMLFLEGRGRRADAREVAARAIAAGAYWADPWQRPPMFTPGLVSKAWWDASEFSWSAKLEAAYPIIKAEMLEHMGGKGGCCFPEGEPGSADRWARVGDARARQDAEIIAPGGEWRELVVFDADRPSQETNDFLPKTRELLEELLPDAVAMARLGAGEIIFSALAPGTKLLPHCASSNVRLTCHLGLVCPQGASLRVGSEWRGWEEGKCIFFDDSYEHEVVHEGSEVRAVLLIRFWHPALPAERWIPTLNAGMEQYNRMQQRRTVPPLSPAVLRWLERARQASQQQPAAAESPPSASGVLADGAALLKADATDLAVGPAKQELATAVDAAVVADDDLF